MTAAQFFEALGARLGVSPLVQVGGLIEFEVEGAGSWFVNFDQGTVARAGKKPQCIVRAAERDLMALVEGRMSVSDGLLTERLHVAGEAARLSRLLEALPRLASP